MNSQILDNYIQETQQKWDVLFNRHRLTLVTQGNEEMLQFFEGLKLISGKKKDERYELFLENKHGTCHLIVELIFDQLLLEIEHEEKVLVSYTDLGTRIYAEWGLSLDQPHMEMILFFQDIRRYVREVAKDIQLCCEFNHTKNEC